MLIEFSIANLLSYKEKVTFSMEATSDKKLSSNYIEKNKYKLLKTAAIYGPNAAGKSNFYKIFTCLVLWIRQSSKVDINAEIPVIPFQFDEKSKKKPSFVEIKFIINNIRYTYGFKADRFKIHEEYLYSYPNNKITKLFVRKNTDEYTFSNPKKELELLSKNNPKNKFFLSTATNWNYLGFKDAYDFITQKICTFQFSNENALSAAEAYYNDKTGELKKFALKEFKKADIQIDDFEVKEVVTSLDDKGSNKTYFVTVMHNVNGKKHYLDLLNESLGTQVLFSFIPYIKVGMDKQCVLFIDELDRSLHPHLVQHLVNLFNEQETNHIGTQLLFNTHDTNLLNLNDLRRDQIWFVEKNSKTGSSDMYSLCDFSPRNNENIERGYLLGKYGAVPFITNDIKLWEEKD